MNIFVDFHHSQLYESLETLFEKRLGHGLFHPYGMEWFTSGNWKIGDPYGEGAINTARQFLQSATPSDGTAVIYPYRQMSFDEFKNTPIDIIIASYYGHIELYEKLRQQYHPEAKLLVQYGNDWPIHPMIRNLLSSTAPMNLPSNVNAYYYHPEFKTADFKPSQRLPLAKISSFVNALNINDIFYQDYQDFLKLEMMMSEYKFQSFGGGCRNGSLNQRDVAKEMQESSWCIQFKSGGDGYGFVAHQAAAVGCPFLFKGSQYKGKLAGKLMKHLETGIDVEMMGVENVPNYIRSLSTEEYLRYRSQLWQEFRRLVDFAKEAREIEKFIENLQ